jgi:hypothetical protein
MIARSQFRNDAAEFGMDIDLAVQGMGKETFAAVVKGNTGFIAGCFYT